MRAFWSTQGCELSTPCVTGDGKGYIQVAALTITTKRKEAGLELWQLSAHRHECLATLEEARRAAARRR